MKVFFYCQHVLGVGHFFRSLEIVRSMSAHKVTLVTGGPPVNVDLPGHVHEIRLPGLAMDQDFSRLLSTDSNVSLEQAKERRQEILFEAFANEKPDVFLVELYPFGRKAFGFELQPLLEQIQCGDLPPCKVICSLRDILVEKKDPPAYEKRVTNLLNGYFHGLAVHADPGLVSLDQTFASVANIDIPIEYTGFVAPKPRSDATARIRIDLGPTDGRKLIVASAGGGSVGFPLLRRVVDAFNAISSDSQRLYVFTGPFMEQGEFDMLHAMAGENVKVLRFTNDFLSFLSVADLSISMAGYNTSMNILATGAPALVWPFAQNREQRMRAEQLSALGPLSVLSDQDLEPARLGKLMEDGLNQTRGYSGVNLEGAVNTARWIESLAENKGRT